MNGMKCIHIGEMSGIVEARQTAMNFCKTKGFSEVLSGNVSLIVTELATNLVKHAGSGELLIRSCTEGDVSGIECLALDRGMGITDIGGSLRGKYPATAGKETGLMAVRRLSSLFDLYSIPGKGTAVLSRIETRSPEPVSDPPHPLCSTRPEVGVVCLPLVPDEPCGDGWEVIRSENRTVILVIDGLGHGPEASKVQVEAIRVFRKNPAGEPVEILRNLHAALRNTRGGVAAIAAIDEERGRVTYTGAGNISGRIITGHVTNKMVSLSGTVGDQIRQFSEFSYPWVTEALLIMYSDGLTMQWDLEDYPGLERKHPALIAGVLYRDHTRGTDDVTVLAVKLVGETS